MSLGCPAFLADAFPALCRAVDHYCERVGPAPDAEPLNALSNAAFLLAAAAAWRLYARQAPSRGRGPIGALIVLMAVIGLGSFLFHTLATGWAQWADVLPILAFILLYVWLILTLFFGWPAWLKLPAVALVLLATVYAEAGLPAGLLWGGALYLPALLIFVVFSIALWPKAPAAARAIAVAGLVFLLSFTVRTLDMPLCEIWPQGTHFLWHLLNAVVLYLLMRLAIRAGGRRGRARPQ